MLNNKYEYTKIRENIWQIAEDKGVYSTLVKGSKMAVLIDTGYGARNLRAFVEENITTPYMVINSHGHPDHIGGNHWFDTVYSLKEEWDVIKYFEENQPMKYEMKEIQIGQHISLGDLNIIVVSLVGHTKGSIGFIVQEEEILIAGDALNEGLWLFNYGSLSMMDLYQTIKATTELNFSTYLCGHSNEEYHKEKLFSHMKNIENLKIDSSTKQNTIGFETYCSKYEDANGKSEIVFTIDKVMKSAKLEYRSFAIEDAQLYLEKEIHKKGITMINDNTTPMAASAYDKEINNTIPYYSEFYEQTLDVIEQCKFSELDWLDLGCGTGTLEQKAFERFEELKFVLLDPSEKMLEQAKQKLENKNVQYICGDSVSINYESCFDVVTAIQSHHYMGEKERREATEKVYKALKKGGIYISFENVVPSDEEIKNKELLRWGKYQQRHGKTEAEAKAHNARCGVNYFPLTVEEHIELVKKTGFVYVHVFWYSYMQMGIYAIK